MDSNYEKGIFNQLTDEVVSLHEGNTNLKEEVSCLKQNNAVLEERTKKLGEENHILRNDNERMKISFNNDSSNSSNPPSKGQLGKAPKTFHSRKSTKKAGGSARGNKFSRKAELLHLEAPWT